MSGMISAFLRSQPVVYKTYGAVRYVVHKTMVSLLELQHARRGRSAPDGRPLPGPTLRHRVSGTFDATEFLRVGAGCARAIERLVALSGRDLQQPQTVLEFACGCGRVIRHFKERPPTAHWLASDLDKEAIDWCRQYLDGIAEFSVNDQLPPTRYAADSIDVIYVISLFTHLDEAMQLAWLGEFHRILKTGGRLVATFHGPRTHALLGEQDQGTLGQHGFLFRVGQTGQLKLDGLPDFYQTAYHTEAYIRRRWASGFAVIAYEPGAIDGFQDAVVMTKTGNMTTIPPA